mmetsp:Transcript_68340/g.199941  ORF Transcript_68340/g.199941 Transcript_68340/m.199941 type:complete len:415 (-) Transcript_68340:64-1308(-)
MLQRYICGLIGWRLCHSTTASGPITLQVRFISKVALPVADEQLRTCPDILDSGHGHKSPASQPWDVVPFYARGHAVVEEGPAAEGQHADVFLAPIHFDAEVHTVGLQDLAADLVQPQSWAERHEVAPPEVRQRKHPSAMHRRPTTTHGPGRCPGRRQHGQVPLAQHCLCLRLLERSGVRGLVLSVGPVLRWGCEVCQHGARSEADGAEDLLELGLVGLLLPTALGRAEAPQLRQLRLPQLRRQACRQAQLLAGHQAPACGEHHCGTVRAPAGAQLRLIIGVILGHTPVQRAVAQGHEKLRRRAPTAAAVGRRPVPGEHVPCYDAGAAGGAFVPPHGQELAALDHGARLEGTGSVHAPAGQTPESSFLLGLHWLGIARLHAVEGCKKAQRRPAIGIFAGRFCFHQADVWPRTIVA